MAKLLLSIIKMADFGLAERPLGPFPLAALPPIGPVGEVLMFPSIGELASDGLLRPLQEELADIGAANAMVLLDGVGGVPGRESDEKLASERNRRSDAGPGPPLPIAFDDNELTVETSMGVGVIFPGALYVLLIVSV